MTIEPLEPIKDRIHQLNNLLQAALSYLELGHTEYEKNDFAASKQYFTRALETVRNMAALLRQLAQVSVALTLDAQKAAARTKEIIETMEKQTVAAKQAVEETVEKTKVISDELASLAESKAKNVRRIDSVPKKK